MVNTFIITNPLLETFALLDYKRLGKQRLEAKQIIDILEKIDRGENVNNIGFSNHPVTKMWKGYTDALKAYFNYCVKEWIRRGYKNTMQLYDIDETKFKNMEIEYDGIKTIFKTSSNKYNFPPFASFPPFINSHRESLLRKNPEYYSNFRTQELEPYTKVGYIWPAKIKNKIFEEYSINMHETIFISENLVKKWLKDKTKNPETGRLIKKDAKTWNEYKKSAEYYGLI